MTRSWMVCGAVAALAVCGGSAWGGPARGDGDPIRSPDGKWIVTASTEADGKDARGFARRYALLKVTRAGGSAARLVWDTRKILPDSGAERQAMGGGAPMQYGIILAGWSPDSRHVLFWPRWEFAGSLNTDGVSLYWIDRGGGAPVRLVDCMLHYDDWIAFAPGGRYLAATEGEGRQTWTSKRIVLVDTRSGKGKQITPDSAAATWPRWSPDGRWIVYSAGPDVGDTPGQREQSSALAKRRVWIVRRDGTGARALTHDDAHRDEAPEWSADGNHIVFVRVDKRHRAALWSMRADGSDCRRISRTVRLVDAFGYYGYVDWTRYFDRRSRSARPAPSK